MRVPLAYKWGGIIVEKAGGGKIVRYHIFISFIINQFMQYMYMNM